MTRMTGSVPASAWTIDEGFRLLHGGRPALLLGGQVHNSSSSSERSIADSFAHVRRMHGNTVLAPVSWALIEPDEGDFDFDLVDMMLEQARANGLRLVLLWFGAFKNAASTYAPRWVRADEARFPRAVAHAAGLQAFSYQGATPKPVLSVFGDELRAADATAFEALMTHLLEADHEDTVAMVQVENESGLLSDSRDRSPLADRAWDSPVPGALLEHLARGGSSPTRDLWRDRGAATAGSWADVLATTCVPTRSSWRGRSPLTSRTSPAADARSSRFRCTPTRGSVRSQVRTIPVSSRAAVPPRA